MKLTAADVRRAVRRLYRGTSYVEVGLRNDRNGLLSSDATTWEFHDDGEPVGDLLDLGGLGAALDTARAKLDPELRGDLLVYVADLYCYRELRDADGEVFESELLGNAELRVYADGRAAVVDQSTGETFVVNRTPSSDRQSGGDV